MYPYCSKNKSVEDFLFTDIFYTDQVQATKSLISQAVAQAVHPTGMGKSLIAGGIICIHMSKNEIPGIYTMASPTKVLGEQLLVSQIILMAACGIKKVAVMCVNSDSGETFLNRTVRKYIQKASGVSIEQGRNSVRKSEIAEFINNAHQKGYHVLLSSTYHSMHRILEALESSNKRINVHINDEPQKLVTDQFKDLVENDFAESDDEDLNAEQFVTSIHSYTDHMYSLTATPRHTYDADGIGMQNFDRFGPVVFEMSEKEAYELGRKVPPRLARLTGLDFEITGAKSMGLLVKKSFEQFDKRWSKHSIRAKVLYDTQGSKEIKWFAESEQKQELISSGVNVAHADSVNGYWINDQKYDTIGEWRNGLLDLPEVEPLIVLHIQMLVEGLDVPGFNSLLLTRTREKSSLKQLIGRIQRLLSSDRDQFGYGKNFKPTNILNAKNAKSMTKPYALVAVLEQRKDVYSFLKDVADLMRKEYGIDHDKIADYSEWKGTGEESSDDDGDQRIKSEKQKAKDKFLKDQYDAKLVEETNTEMYGNMTAVQKALKLSKIAMDWMKK